jgi:hypothetical protein
MIPYKTFKTFRLLIMIFCSSVRMADTTLPNANAGLATPIQTITEQDKQPSTVEKITDNKHTTIFDRKQKYRLTRLGIDHVCGPVYEDSYQSLRPAALTDEMVIFLNLFLGVTHSTDPLSQYDYKHGGLRHRHNRQDRGLDIGDIMYDQWERLSREAVKEKWLEPC